MPRPFHTLAPCLLGILVLAGCHRATESPASEPQQAPAAPAAPAAGPAAPSAPANDGPTVAEADLGAVLEEMTQALRKFSFERKRLPSSLDELVTAGYLGALPKAPAGRRFAIEPRETRIVVR